MEKAWEDMEQACSDYEMSMFDRKSCSWNRHEWDELVAKAKVDGYKHGDCYCYGRCFYQCAKNSMQLLSSWETLCCVTVALMDARSRSIQAMRSLWEEPWDEQMIFSFFQTLRVFKLRWG
jgi:hypothetical protein